MTPTSTRTPTDMVALRPLVLAVVAVLALTATGCGAVGSTASGSPTERYTTAVKHT